MGSAVDHSTIRKPVIHHVHELQKRIMWSVLAIIAGAALAYSVNGWLLEAVRAPLGETLYYTSPMGGFSFLLKLCVAVGFIVALPVILYQFFAFLGPLLKKHHKLTIVAFALWSFDLAYCGLLFAYFVSLPSALHFLAQFGGSSIESMITVNEYFNFALAYLAGFALIFQVPLIVLFINRIKPLKPSKMIGAQRYIILFSFIGAAILTPTPDPVNQAIMAIPAVLLYQVGIVLVWLANREKRKDKKRRLAAAKSESHRKHAKIVHAPKQQVPQPVARPVPVAALAAPSKTSIISQAPIAQPVRRATRQSIDGFRPASSPIAVQKRPMHLPKSATQEFTRPTSFDQTKVTPGQPIVADIA